MNLLDILAPECVQVPLAASDKRNAINELVDLLAKAGRVADPSTLKEAVWTREQTRTTGIGHGLAIPHGKCVGMSGLAMAIGKPISPMDFSAMDQQPVKLIVLLASPPDRVSDHIQALARITKLMFLTDFRERVYQAQSSSEVFDLLKARDASQ
jgi:mannitol/fructose-specific phosphotransferase system IIA component (Ntr-type)